MGSRSVSPSNTLTSLTLGADSTKPVRPYDNYFRLVGADSAQAVFLADQARKLGYTKVAVVSETKAVSSGLADQFAAAFTKAGGTVTVRTTVPDGADNFTDFINAAAPTTPGLLFFGGEYNVAATLRTQATAAGLTVPLMGGDGMNDPSYITGAGAAAAGSYASGVGVPLAQLPGAAKFLAEYKAAGFTTQPSDYGPYAYDAANAVIATLQKALKGKTSLPSRDPRGRGEGPPEDQADRRDRHDPVRPVRRRRRRDLHPLPGRRAARRRGRRWRRAARPPRSRLVANIALSSGGTRWSRPCTRSPEPLPASTT